MQLLLWSLTIARSRKYMTQYLLMKCIMFWLSLRWLIHLSLVLLQVRLTWFLMLFAWIYLPVIWCNILNELQECFNINCISSLASDVYCGPCFFALIVGPIMFQLIASSLWYWWTCPPCFWYYVHKLFIWGLRRPYW